MPNRNPIALQAVALRNQSPVDPRPPQMDVVKADVACVWYIRLSAEAKDAAGLTLRGTVHAGGVESDVMTREERITAIACLLASFQHQGFLAPALVQLMQSQPEVADSLMRSRKSNPTGRAE